jgi:hypothetical protein
MTQATSVRSSTPYDVTKAIDEGGFTTVQKMAYLFAALAIVLDGFDGQMIGYAIPLIMKEWGVYYFSPQTVGYGRSGVPDIICCYKGRFIAIECKAGKNKPTDLQTLNLKRIDEAGGLALVINEENLNQLEFILEAEHPRSNYQLFARPLTEADDGTGTPVKRKPKET